MDKKTVLVTGANGYIGNAVAKAFSRAGWKTFGLIRKNSSAGDLARNEIYPIIGSPEDVSFLDQTNDIIFDVIVLNTEDTNNPQGHFEKVQIMVDAITKHSNNAGVKPLVMFTSGCKDYGGMDKKHGDPGLKPHTENSSMNPPLQLIPRKDFGLSLLKNKNNYFDATVLRPTIVYGLSSSHYGSLFELASNSKTVLKMFANPDAIMHSLHVDDCADAYVLLAEYPNRSKVAQQAFNISNNKYDTASQIGEALAKLYGLKLEFAEPPENMDMSSVHSLANFWQWVGSEKLRELTGWHEKKPTFVDGISQYRLAYDAAMQVKVK